MLPRRKKRERTKQADPDRVDSPGHCRWVRSSYDCATTISKSRDGHMLPCSGPVESHHVRSRGAGGDDSQVVPLCTIHHVQIHKIGADTFALVYLLDLPRMAADLWQKDKYHRGKWEVRKKEMAGV